MRKLLAKILFTLRIPHIAHKWNSEQGKIPILLFHDVNPERNPLTGSLTPEEFERIIVFLKEKYDLVAINSILKSPKSCILTFDDGMYTFMKYAYPIIKKHEVPVTIFLPAESIAEGSTWTLRYFQKCENNQNKSSIIDYKDQLRLYESLRGEHADDNHRLMTWDEIKTLDPDLVSIQSHGLTHRFLSPMIEEDLIKELRISQSIIEKNLNTKVTSIAYPFGDYSNATLKKAGIYYENGFIVEDQLTPVSAISRSMMNFRFHIHNGSVEDLYLRISGVIPLFKKFLMN